MEPGNQYNQRKEFIVSPSAPLFQLVQASLHPFANPDWIPPFVCTAPPQQHLPDPSPDNPLSNDAIHSDQANVDLAAPSSPQAVCETDGTPATHPTDAVQTNTNPFRTLPALPARSPKLTQPQPPSVATRAHLEPETVLPGSGSSGGSGSGRPGHEVMSGSNASWTIIPSAGGGSSMHGGDDDDGSGHAVSLQGGGSSLGGGSGSSIAEPGTPNMHDDVLMSQPEREEDELYGDENVMVEARVYEVPEGIVVNAPWSDFVPGQGKKQRQGSNCSPQVAAAAAARTGGNDADVEMTRVSLEGLTSNPAFEQQHRGTEDAGIPLGSQVAAPGSLQVGLCF